MKTIHIDSAKVTRFLALIAFLLIIASIAGQFIIFILDHPRALGFPPMFYLDDESNLPAYFSSFILGLAAFLLGIIAISKRKGIDHFIGYWTFLAILYLYFSVDEAVSLHERLNAPVRHLLGWDKLIGWKRYFLCTWVVPGILFSLLLILSSLKFFCHLPQKTKYLFFVAAVLSFSGVIGMELISGNYAAQHGPSNFTYSMIITIEETLEMSGTITFIYALLSYINDQDLTIRFGK